MKVVTIIGTRPELVKMSRLIPLLDDKFEHTFIFSGQHYSNNMVKVFFDELGIREPDHFLNVRSSEYSDLILPMVKKLREMNPDFVLVYGDTNSTLAGALAAKRLNKKLIHVEAGLRSFDKRMPEELNRILTDNISDFLFTPTEYTNELLNREGITDDVFIVGNTVVDAVYYYMDRIKDSEILSSLDLDKNDYFLLTLHRQEVVDRKESLTKVIEALSMIDGKIVFPIHPRTLLRLKEFNLKLLENVKVIEPVGYFDFLNLLKNSNIVLTDSGGVQEEAITLKIPCLTLREFTERMETIKIGANFLVGCDADRIKKGVEMAVKGNLKEKIKKMSNPYGDGTASKKIIKVMNKVVK